MDMLSTAYQTATVETIRDKFIHHAGEITTSLQGIKIELSEKAKNKAEITRILHKQQRLLTGKSN